MKGHLAETVAEVVGYSGNIDFDRTKPDGIPRKLMGRSRLNGLGWQAQVTLRDGFTRAYQDYLANSKALR